MRILIYFFLMVVLAGCYADAQIPAVSPDREQFNAYWYAGEAEITSYTLDQARYGEVHPGEAVLIFVTEDFSKKRQVKLDNPNNNREDAVSVLKLNATRQFNTGVYQYNMMQSVFTPVSGDKHPNTLKVTMSSQDWCGQSWLQLNHDDGGYDLEQRSYFESEGDRNIRLKDALLEDEIWTRIRINPQSLPTGQVEMIPGSFYSRLRHTAMAPHKAETILVEDGQTYVYTVDYKELDRKLVIRFEKEFPFQINGWSETYTSGFGPSPKKLTTNATRKETLKLDYWRRHDLGDVGLRKELGLQ